MVGKTSAKRRALGGTPENIAIAKHRLGMKTSVVPVESATGEVSSEVYVKEGARGTAYKGKPQLVHRAFGRKLASKGYEAETGTYGTSSRARGLKECKGKKGCDFAGCVKEKLGHIPTNLSKTCGMTGIMPRGPPTPTAEQLAGARAALMGYRPE